MSEQFVKICRSKRSVAIVLSLLSFYRLKTSAIASPNSDAATFNHTLDLEYFGAAGDGVCDDTAAFLAAVKHSNTISIRLAIGRRYRLKSAIKVFSNLKLYGGGTILVDFDGTGLHSFSGNIDLTDIVFDGCQRAIGALQIDRASSCAIKHCRFENFTSDTYVHAVTCVDVETLVISNSSFLKLRAYANGKQGDTIGAIRAIYISGNIRMGNISNNLFQDINNFNCGVTWEDADAIHCAPLRDSTQDIRFENNTFTNIGKRALKLAGNVGCKYTVVRNLIRSAWLNTVDDSKTYGNGMFFDIEHFGGDLICNNNRHDGGVSGGMLALSSANVRRVVFSNNLYLPEYHKYSNCGLTVFVGGSGLIGKDHIEISNNYSINTYLGLVGVEGGLVYGNRLFTRINNTAVNYP